MLENTANQSNTFAPMDLSFLDGVSSFIGEKESLENQNSFSASTVATSATSATCSEVFNITDDFIFSTATCSATSATNTTGTTDMANTAAFVDYVLQDCPDGPVMNPSDEELIRDGIRATREHIAMYGTQDMTFAPEDMTFVHDEEELGTAASALFAKLGENATPEQIQGLTSLMSDAKLLKIERVADTRLSSGMLMTNQKTGKPLRCIHCGHRRQVEGSAWWVGECSVCGERKGNKNYCSVVVG